MRVLAAPLNPVDLTVAGGHFFAGHPSLPYIPGVEAVGRVVSTDSSAQDRLVFTCLHGLGTSRDGCCADYAVAPVDRLIPVPDDVEPAIAAAIGTAGLAAWLPLTWRAPITPGETVLALGATGTVGLIAVQAAKLLGAGRVVAAGRRQEGLDLAVRLGADAAVQLETASDLAQAFRETCAPTGPTFVFDALWGEPLVAALGAAAAGARVVQLGQSAGATAAIPSALVRGKSLDIRGYTNFGVPFDVLAEGYSRLVEHVRAGRIHVEVEQVPLEEGAIAWQRQQSGPGTKLVLCP